MPLDVLGRTRATLSRFNKLHNLVTDRIGQSFETPRRDRDRLIAIVRSSTRNILVNASHQLALITSLPFVHTARRSYRLDESSEPFGLSASRKLRGLELIA